MSRKSLSSLTDQVTELLRQGMVEGRWRETLPGRDRLAEELGCSHWTVEEALRRLAKQGLLVPQGAGRRRRIEISEETLKTRALRVAILVGEPSDRTLIHLIELVHALRNAGHVVDYAEKSLFEMGYKLERVVRFVETSEPDAWVIFGGSREVLKWFSEGRRPAFALAGRASRLPLPSVAPDKLTPMRMAVRRLVELGHQRIVLMSRALRRIPEPGQFERAFINELEAHGIATGPYNLPNWIEDPEGYQAGLEALFRNTPPTAMLLDQTFFLVPTLQFCMSKGLQVPRDLSLVSVDPDPAFIWCQPSVAHIHWDTRPLVRRIVRWTGNVRRGKEDRRKTMTKAEFVAGGTIGPVPATFPASAKSLGTSDR